MSSIQAVNNLLNDKLYQVIGSTPASIAESLKKIDLRGNSKAGAQLFAICIFAAAVNKSTLETFIADSRFAEVRPLITAAMSISGRSNMTALTLLGHCFLTTDSASEVIFAVEFRKKMGQQSLWSGELESGSLSDMQKKILKEKKRITVEKEAKALGAGFLKHCGLASGQLTGLEKDYFGTGFNADNVVNQGSTGTSQVSSGTISSGVNRRQLAQPSAIPAMPTSYSMAPPASQTSRGTTLAESPPRGPSSSRRNASISMGTLSLNSSTEVQVPLDTIDYRKNVLNQTDEEIAESYNRRGREGFIEATRRLINDDPEGTRVQNARSNIG